MADTTEVDTNVLDLGLLVPALMALIAGLLIHSFIIGVNVSDWWRGRSVTPVDHIVTSLAISRICSQFASIIGFIGISLHVENPHFLMSMIFMSAAFESTIFADIWLTSFLSIILCLKISNLRTRLFLYLRRMISHRTGRLIGASITFSSFSGLMILLFAVYKISCIRTYNTTTAEKSKDCVYSHSFYIFTTGVTFPLLIYCISSVLLFFSLYHHTTRMKMSSNLSINLETYYSAMRFLCFTFIYNTIYYFVHFIAALFYFFHCVVYLWLFIPFGFFPVLHSSCLIYTIAKLRNQVSKVLHNVMDFLFHGKRLAIPDNIEAKA